MENKDKLVDPIQASEKPFNRLLLLLILEAVVGYGYLFLVFMAKEVLLPESLLAKLVDKTWAFIGLAITVGLYVCWMLKIPVWFWGIFDWITKISTKYNDWVDRLDG